VERCRSWEEGEVGVVAAAQLHEPVAEAVVEAELRELEQVHRDESAGSRTP
jgi:hypothetical protein